MKYANKLGAKFLCVIGERELETGLVSLKNMADGSQKEISVDAVADEF